VTLGEAGKISGARSDPGHARKLGSHDAAQLGRLALPPARHELVVVAEWAECHCARSKVLFLFGPRGGDAVDWPRREGFSMVFDRITSEPATMNGQPCVRRLRLTVRRVLEALATYPDRAELLREYPELEAEDIRQVLAYAAASLDDKVVELPKSA
jgi:uncharacterized protein (DUF433 family)